MLFKLQCGTVCLCKKEKARKREREREGEWIEKWY